jgi:predicted transcriptional regulator of viral defense system
MEKHISYRSAELLKKLHMRNQDFFTLKDAKEILPNSEESAIRKLLSDMTKRNLILRIKDGLYNIIPYEKESDKYFPNWHLVAEKLVQSEEYYIGFYSALDIHSLVTQPSLSEQIVTKKQFTPKNQLIKKVKFEFITYNEQRFFGFEKIWIDDFNKVFCSDIEKTIIDCLYKPNYSGGISEIIKAIKKSHEQINLEKMHLYLEKFDTQVVLKRLGFILQYLNQFDSLKNNIKPNVSNSYTLLDPSLPKSGKYCSEWKIIDNVGIESAIKSLLT